MPKIEKVAVWRLPDGSYTEDAKDASRAAFDEAIRECIDSKGVEFSIHTERDRLISFIAGNMEEIYKAGKGAVA